MSVIATALKHLMAAGVTGDALIAAVADIEASMVPARHEPTSDEKRRARNAKYYQAKKEREAEETERLKASENRLVGAETSESSETLSLPSSPQTPQLPTHTRRVSSRTRKAARFDEFWRLYPSKVGKKAAVTAYDRAIAEIDADDPEETIIAGLRRALPGWSSGRFIPNPATWLNQGRWDDEPAKATVTALAPPAPPPSADDIAARWDRRVADYRKAWTWNEVDWGPKPGREGCRVAAWILEKHGYAPKTGDAA